jgi:hypothetical protein
VRRSSAQNVLLPGVQRELLRAAQGQLDDEHQRVRRMRAGAFAVTLALLLMPPSAAAFATSSSTSSQVLISGV